MSMKRYEGAGNHTKYRKLNDGSILELPEPIITDILSRVPIGTIFCCRCVCKTFIKILRDPYFVEVHLAKSPNTNRFLIIQEKYMSFKFYCADMIDLEKFFSPENNIGLFPWKTLTMPSAISQYYETENFRADLIGSCNGLVCLSYILGLPLRLYMFCVCNPILGEFMVLPKPWPIVMFSSFGFCPKTKQYKVIRFTCSLYSEVHTLGSNCWRNIGYVPQPSAFSYIGYSSFNGKFSWITKSPEISQTICSFNFETEQYSYIPPPPYLPTRERINRWLCVGVLDGLFCISYLLDNSHFEVCVMKEYGVKESWTKKFTIDMRLNCMSIKGPNHLLSSININQIYITKLMNNGDMVIGCHRKFALLYYCPREGTISDILGLSRDEKERERLQGRYDTIDFVPSFISLKDIGGAGLEVVQRTKLHNI